MIVAMIVIFLVILFILSLTQLGSYPEYAIVISFISGIVLAYIIYCVTNESSVGFNLIRDLLSGKIFSDYIRRKRESERIYSSNITENYEDKSDILSKSSQEEMSALYEGHDRAGHDRSTYDRPAYDRPAYDRAGHDRPAYNRAGHERSAYDRPAYDRTGHDRPAYDRPAYDRAAYDRSGTDSYIAASVHEQAWGRGAKNKSRIVAVGRRAVQDHYTQLEIRKAKPKPYPVHELPADGYGDYKRPPNDIFK